MPHSSSATATEIRKFDKWVRHALKQNHWTKYWNNLGSRKICSTLLPYASEVYKYFRLRQQRLLCESREKCMYKSKYGPLFCIAMFDRLCGLIESIMISFFISYSRAEALIFTTLDKT